MIVRISGEGQFKLSAENIDSLNQLDNQAVAAVDAGDEVKFAELWTEMLALIESQGTLLGDEELAESDLILPPRDATFAEAKADFSGEGLIPD